MKISEIILNLKTAMEIHGDIDCITASDDEGNSFNAVNFRPSAGYFLCNGDFIPFDSEDLKEYDLENEKIVLCIN